MHNHWYRLFNHPDFIGILPIFLENPESQPIYNWDGKNPNFDIHSDISNFSWYSYNSRTSNRVYLTKIEENLTNCMKYRLKSKTCTRRHKNKNTEKNDNQFIKFSKKLCFQNTGNGFSGHQDFNFFREKPLHPLATYPIGAPVTRRCLKNIPILHTQTVGQFVEVLPIKVIHKPT